MGPTNFRTALGVLGATFLLLATAGCGSGGTAINDPFAPTPEETGTVSNGDNVTFPLSGVRVVAAGDSFNTGESITFDVILDPANLPLNIDSPTIHRRVATVNLVDTFDSNVQILTPLTVTIPLREQSDVERNQRLRVFRFDFDAGEWKGTGQNAIIDDTATKANFTIADDGVYGVFYPIPLAVDAIATPNIAKAPVSATLKARIEGGTPPYTVIWAYGDDAQPEAGEVQSHLYKDPITYTATTTVIDALGNSVTDFVQIRAH